ncbi:MAG: transglutaminase family protein [Gomphosphaeria aponina SAG 52.96 = DSM 107014]|uniref:Transglutaminase family protein n=1 Tax=Gomphosphaeria aponina SAG 52.96 = DSM 107014 TaxID=1521640 RepID=A0A941JKX9_9CHRO|nr:transglutaminase family protein [Gomphosphaeria aponina SAG 52.96 = DSM 107014]
MTITVGLHHQLKYSYSRSIILGPHTIGLRPSPHCRTPIQSYSLKISPPEHYLTWLQDVYGNFLARVNFLGPTNYLNVEVALIAQLQTINPFNFLLEDYAINYPFTYPPELAKQLVPFLEITESGSLLQAWVEKHRQKDSYTTNFILELNQQLAQEINYQIRLEAGIQSCEETLGQKIGSCRDTGWLFVQILRYYGLAARFVSGYLIQLTPDIPPGAGPMGPEADQGDLHAWTEVYLPGAGWIGLDPTSGFLAAEGHLPLVCTPDPLAASPVRGTTEPCTSQLDFSVIVSRYEETPRTTKPYTEQQWEKINSLGNTVEASLQRYCVDLTMGGVYIFGGHNPQENSLEWLQNSITLSLTLELRNGSIDLFPPWQELITAIEGWERESGAIAINLHPVSNWAQLVAINTILAAAARQCGLETEKYLLDGRPIPGGCTNIVIAPKQESPFWRRPDLVRSLITYFHNHPSLAAVFGQTPKSHEYLSQLGEMVDGRPEHFLKNNHLTGFDFEQLFSQGGLELRGLAMFPHYQMGLLQMLLLRSLFAWFWETPYTKPLNLGDSPGWEPGDARRACAFAHRFMLPSELEKDLQQVIRDLQQAGYEFELKWFEPFFEFHFPRYGEITRDGVQLELRFAAEKQIQVRLREAMGNSERYVVLCNQRQVPLKSTGVLGEYVGAVRFEKVPQLLFEIVDTREKSIGGCTYYINSPSGHTYEQLPVNRREAESRMVERFVPMGHTPGKITLPPLRLE